MAAPNSWNSWILLFVISLTLLIFTGVEVREVVETNSEADTAASSSEIEIVYTLFPLTSVNDAPPRRSLTSVFPIVASIAPIVRRSSIFAWATDKSSVILISSLPKAVTPESYTFVT